MATLRKWVSDVRSMHRLLNSDNLINDRTVASEIRSTTILLVKRETNLRKLWATDTIFEHLPCLEMIEVPISECCDYVDPCTVARSKYKLPRIAEGNYQYLIQGVYSINAMGGMGTKFKEITINRYLNLLKLPIIKNESYYFIVNDYLYVTNPLIQAVRMAAYFEEDIPNEIKFSECCGQGVTNDEYCKNPLDREFALPGYLADQVKEIVSQKLITKYFNVKSDMTQDEVDGQAPNTKPTN